MVKFFESKDKWGGVKWNWVSDTDSFIGFDASSICCESFGYFYSEKVNGGENSYLYETVHKKLKSGDNNFDLGIVEVEEMGEGFGISKETYVYIELLDKDFDELVCYIVLYNLHNGFYSHGLTYKTTYEEKDFINL